MSSPIQRTTTVFVRPAREEDAESIVELLNAIIQCGTYTIMTEQVSVSDQIEFIRESPSRGVYNVAVDRQSQMVVGCQDVLRASRERALAHVGEISTFVALDLRRRGIGQSLCKATFETARLWGFRKLMAAVRADNPDALAFYRGQGFAIIGTARAHACVRGRYIDEILMERPIATEQQRAGPASGAEPVRHS